MGPFWGLWPLFANLQKGRKEPTQKEREQILRELEMEEDDALKEMMEEEEEEGEEEAQTEPESQYEYEMEQERWLQFCKMAAALGSSFWVQENEADDYVNCDKKRRCMRACVYVCMHVYVCVCVCVRLCMRDP